MDTQEAEHELVHLAIQSLASKEDFSPQDAKFGRRIAAEPLESWSAEVRAEAARILTSYRGQVEQYLDIDVAELGVVQTERDSLPSQRARDEARLYARRRKAMVEVTHRRVEMAGDLLAVSWHRADPEAQGLLDAMRSVPGHWWDAQGQRWLAPASRELAEVVKVWEYPVKGTPARLLREAAAKPLENAYQVRLDPQGAVIELGGDRQIVGVSPELLDYARRLNLSIDPLVLDAVVNLSSVNPLPAMLAAASDCAIPEQLPTEFVALVRSAVKSTGFVHSNI